MLLSSFKRSPLAGRRSPQGEPLSTLHPWRVLSSKRIHADKWISLRADRCVTTEGVEVSPYYVLEYPDWVHVVAIGRDGQVLLVEQYRHGVGVVTLEIPAGRMDRDDGSAEAAARRELQEETGCGAAEIMVVNASSPNPASHSNKVYSVLATGVEQTADPIDDPRERLRPVWVGGDEAFRLAVSGALPAMQAASLLSAFQHLGLLRFAGRHPPPGEPQAEI